MVSPALPPPSTLPTATVGTTSTAEVFTIVIATLIALLFIRAIHISSYYAVKYTEKRLTTITEFIDSHRQQPLDELFDPKTEDPEEDLSR